MRIVIAGQTYAPGNNGQAIFTMHLAEGLAAVGHDVHMFVPHRRWQYVRQVRSGVNLHQVRSLNFDWVHPEAYLGFLPYGQIRRALQRIRPDVIHLQDHYFLSRDVLLASRGMGVPLVGTNHFLPENVLPYLHVLPLPRRTKIDILWKLMLWTYNELDVVTTPTTTAARILEGAGIRIPVEAVSCGVDIDHFTPPTPGQDRAAGCRQFGLDPSKVLFLYVGRLDREKRLDVLLRALASLAAAGRRNIQLAIAGQGAARGELQAMARSLGVDGMVRFLGFVPDSALPLLYQTAHIFAMPSPEELQSIATLEAMASGRPVLAADARALPELVVPGWNGDLFEPGKPESAARGMEGLAARPHDWEAMGHASRNRAVAHSLQATIRRYEAIYRRAAGLPPAATPARAPAGASTGHSERLAEPTEAAGAGRRRA